MSGCEITMRIGKRADALDRAIEWLLVALLAFMPLAFGAVEAWSEAVVIALTGAIGMCFLLKGVLVPPGFVTWSWTYVPVLAFIILAVIQLVAWPVGWLHVVSPSTVALKTELLQDLPQSTLALSKMAVSFYSYGTRHDLRLVLAVATLFVVVLNVYRRADQIKRLLGVIAVVGGLFAVLALAQVLFGNGKIYWLVTMPGGGARSGPFVNHSHYGQFMNLSIGAALGLIFVRFREVFSRRRARPGAVAEYLGSPEARPIWALLALVILGVGTIFLSMTRGGMVSTLVAMTLTALALSLNRSLRGTGWIMALLALGAFTCVLYLGFDAVYDRLGTLRRLDSAQGSRWQILQDVAVAWTRFPMLGTGLGTHEVVYPMFDRSSVPEIAAYAENEYAQTAEETGLLGLAALAALGVMIGGCYVRATRSNAAPVCAAGYGLGFGLVAILVHSLSDFGQHVPANAALSAIFCALLICLSRQALTVEATTLSTARPWRLGRGFWIAALVMAAGAWGWAPRDAEAALTAASHWTQASEAEQNLINQQWQGSDEEYLYLLTWAAKAQNEDPGNVKYRHWLNAFRWRAVSRTIDPNVDEITLAACKREFAARIADELNQARVLCPTFGASWVVLGQLERYVLGLRDQGARHIRMGARLAPCDATARLVAGTLEAEERNVEPALAHLQKAVQLDAQLFEEAVSVPIDHLSPPDLALQLAGGDVRRLVRAATVLERSTDGSRAATEAMDKAVHLLEQSCEAEDASPEALEMLAQVYEKQDKTDRAIECYRRILALNYGDVVSRFNLAKLLVETRASEEAMQQARICVHLRPEFTMARQLVEDLSLAAAAAGPCDSLP